MCHSIRKLLVANRSEIAIRVFRTAHELLEGDDTFIPEETIQAFRAALDKAGVKYDLIAYPGVVHSFTVPEADSHNIPGLKYDKKADEDSWQRLEKLLAEKLGK
jgi:dienelactone hydrolase